MQAICTLEPHINSLLDALVPPGSSNHPMIKGLSYAAVGKLG